MTSVVHNNRSCYDKDVGSSIGQRPHNTSIRDQMIEPPIKLNLSSLTQVQQRLYEYTWCSGDKVIADIINYKLTIKVNGRDRRNYKEAA